MIDARVSHELNTLRSCPINENDHSSWVMEITESRSRNNKLRIRMRDLMGYIEKLEAQNRRLEEERRVIQMSELHRKRAGEDWRVKIDTLQKENLSYETDLRERIRIKEEEAIRNVRVQEMEIQERNQKRRMQSLSGKLGSPMTPLARLNSRYVR